MNKQARLEELAREIVEREVCAELAKGATQLVFGAGSPDADIVLVGEAPGKNEDLGGEPFVGAAGKILDSLLEAANLSRKDVYITNIVKYRPPNNRDPSPKEKAEFWPYLLREIEIIQPKIIMTLGRHSGAYFKPDLEISKCHGQAFEIILGENKYILATMYHPAAALYNGRLRQTLMDDFAKVVGSIGKAKSL